jgi:hypothetical protein
MKTKKTSKQPKRSKPTVQLKDLKPKKDAKGSAARKGEWVLDTTYERSS